MGRFTSRLHPLLLATCLAGSTRAQAQDRPDEDTKDEDLDPGLAPPTEPAFPVTVTWRPDTGGPDIRYGDWLRFRPDGYISFRHTLNYRWEDLQPIEDELGTEQRPLGQTWHIPRFRFRLLFNITEYAEVFVRVGAIADGSMVADTAYAQFTFGEFSLRAGRYWVNILPVEGPWANEQQFVDYSFVAQEFSPGSAHGVRFGWSRNGTEVYLHLTDGIRTGFTRFLDPLAADIAVSFRVESALAGPRNVDIIYRRSSFRGSEPGLVGGISGHYQTGGKTGITRDLYNIISNADLTAYGSGWSLSASGTWSGGSLGPVRNDFHWAAGFLLQGGVFVHDQVELAYKYDALFADGRPDVMESTIGRDDLHTLGIGLNYFIIPRSYALRLQWDFQYVINPLNQDAADIWEGVGLTTTFESGQVISRAQIIAGF